MSAFEDEIAHWLREIRQKGLYRSLRRIDGIAGNRVIIDGRSVLNWSSNDYLGLANHPRVVEAAAKAAKDYGGGARASRLICGSLAVHHQLDEALAEFEGTEAALSFSSGYLAAIGTISALVGPGDVVIVDKLVHACHVDGARLSGAQLRVFPHNDLDRLEAILRWVDRRRSVAFGSTRQRVLIVTESVFSMDGDQARLRELVELKDKYGAWVLVDEAHATGLYGLRRTGLAEEMGVADRVEVRMGTLGKALGAAGGYICGSRLLIEYLVNKARSFIFSTAPPPAAAAAAMAAIQIVSGEEGKRLCDRVWANASAVASQIGLVSSSASSVSPGRMASSLIMPIILGDETRAVETAGALFRHGILIPAVRYPTVPRGTARLRLTVTAVHDQSDIAQLLSALRLVGLARPEEVRDDHRTYHPATHH